MPVLERRAKPSIANPKAVASFRAALDRAGYTFDAVRRAMHSDESLSPPPQQVPLIARGLGDGPLGTLVRLFLIGVPVPVEHARRTLAPLSLMDCASLGVLAFDKNVARGLVRLIPHDELILAGDYAGDAPAPMPNDYVMGFADSSRQLSRLTVRRPVDLALDLGTGCGVHAILAARHAKRVIATDVNTRALGFTRFNAALNGVTNVECRDGAWFEPVEGLEFDLIVSNPPFVISPDSEYVYRDAGYQADGASRQIVQETPRHLKEGGIAVMLVNWVHQPNDDWSTPLRAWVAGSGTDAWLLHEASYNPTEYAVLWNQRLAFAGAMAAYAETVDRWTRYYAQLGIEALGYGGLILRRRSGENWVRADDFPRGGLKTDVGPDLDRQIQVQDQLDTLDDAALLAQTVSVAPEHRLEQTLRWKDGRFRIVNATLIREQGLQETADLDAPLATLLSLIDGARTVAGVLETTADALGQSGEAAQAFQEQALPVVRQMIAFGFLQI